MRSQIRAATSRSHRSTRLSLCLTSTTRPITEARRQWSAHWPDRADHMAAITSVMRVRWLEPEVHSAVNRH
jgi:hypothetical protein